MNNTPFDPVEPPAAFAESTPVASGALEAMERAQIDMQIATAKKYPRIVAKVKEEILAIATLDDETASSCFYTLKRGDKTIQGPSIRLAEIGFSCWGNIRAGTRIAETVVDGPMPHVVVQSVAHDLEKNTCITMEKRRRVFKKRSKGAPDEDDVNLAANACSSIALRDAILRVIPKTIINSACAAAMRKAIGDPKSLVEKRLKVVARLKQMGVSEERILAAVECAAVDDIGSDQLGTLIGLGTAIRDGETTLEDAFPPVAAAPKKPAFAAKPADEPPDDIPFLQPSAPVRAAAQPQPPAEEERLPDEPRGLHIESAAGIQFGPKATASMAPPTPPPPTGGPTVTPAHIELELFLEENGISFERLHRWAVETSWEPGFDSYASLAELPAKSVQRLLRAKAGLLKQLAPVA
jgi:hypothetical protein